MPPKVAALAVAVALTGGSAGASTRHQLAYARLELPSLGFVVVDELTSCGAYCTSSRPHLFVEGDASSWREITPPGMLFQFEDVQFSSPVHGWVVDNDCAAGKAFVYRTHDAGRRWRRAPVRSTNCAAGSRLDLSFADRRHGWMLDVYANGNAPYPLLRTRDGGATWTGVGGTPIAGAITFRTAREGWLGRGDFMRPQQLYMTLNGGRTWRRRTLSPPSGWDRARLFPHTPTFFGRRGVLPVTLTRSGRTAVAFYLTRDGGRKWSVSSVRRVSRSAVNRNSPFVAYVPTAIVSQENWWVVDAGTRASVAVTADGGKSWHTSAAPRFNAREISATDARNAWLANRAPMGLVAYATRDAGRSWQRLRVPTRLRS